MKLLNPGSGDLQFALWGLLRLFDEGVDDGDLPSCYEAVQSSADALLAMWAQFKQALAKALGVGHLEVGAMLHEELGKASVVST